MFGFIIYSSVVVYSSSVRGECVCCVCDTERVFFCPTGNGRNFFYPLVGNKGPF